MLIFALIPAAWLAVVVFGLTMCRLGALSDEEQAVALAEWLAPGRLGERELAAGEPPAGGTHEAQERGFRAAG